MTDLKVVNVNITKCSINKLNTRAQAAQMMSFFCFILAPHLEKTCKLIQLWVSYLLCFYCDFVEQCLVLRSEAHNQNKK